MLSGLLALGLSDSSLQKDTNHSQENSVLELLQDNKVRDKQLRGERIKEELKREGKRLVVGIGDIHYGNGKEFYKFLEGLEERIRIDKVFMEGALNEPCQDPYLEYAKRVAILKGREFEESEYKKRDPQGYYLLSKKWKVVGLDDWKLVKDIFLTNQIYLKFLEAYRSRDGRVDKKSIEEIRKLNSQLETSLELEDYPEIIPPEELENNPLHKKLLEYADKITLTQANNQFFRVIRENLQSGEVGVVIIGKDHFSPPKEKEKYESLTDLLKKESIATVCLTVRINKTK